MFGSTALLGFLSRIRARLRNKLALAMIVVALLPLTIASAVAAQITFGRLERGLTDRALQSAQIALNLLLRKVQRLSRDTTSLASAAELHELLSLQPALVPRLLRGQGRRLVSALVEVTDANGRVVGRRSPDPQRFRPVYSGPESTAVKRALDYERHIDLSRIAGRLAVRISAPAVDEHFVLRGAVVTTLLLDDPLADMFKGIVGAEVGFTDRDHVIASTFRQAGKRRHDIDLSPKLVGRAIAGNAAVAVRELGEREYSFAFAPLQQVDGHRLGLVVVGLDRSELARTNASAARALVLGATVGLAVALILATLLGRAITTPLSRLHRRIQAMAAGDLDQRIHIETSDEIGNLARAFQQMTDTLGEHQQRLAARIRELSTLHQIGRAVGSVLEVDQVLRLVVGELTEVLGASRSALLTVRDRELRLRDHVGLTSGDDGQVELPARWEEVARQAIEQQKAAVERRLLAVPLQTRDRIVGALVLAREEEATFSAADVRLVVTFADQAATAIENSELYEEVRGLSESLERKVRQRTAELEQTNAELARTLEELRDTQSQLIMSDRMAGLGTLVAGVAHEINTPAAAIQGATQILSQTLERALKRLYELSDLGLPRVRILALVKQLEAARRNAGERSLRPPAELRKEARKLSQRFAEHEIEGGLRLSRRLVEAGAEGMAEQVIELADAADPQLVVGIAEDLAFLQRSVHSIGTANTAMVRIVRALRSYAHADREELREVDLTEGIETTLTILHNKLRYGITLRRKYGDIPAVAAYVDELNQVWTNLIHNAVQALEGQGTIEIETSAADGEVHVRIGDDGPGIPAEVMPRIFEAFFSTKPRGEGTGLGLGIARKIVEKHGGRLEVQSRPGRTVFTVSLPLEGPLTRSAELAALETSRGERG